MLAILCTDGKMNVSEVRSECCGEKWVPIFTYTDGESTTVPVFDSVNVAKDFIRRNVPKNWLHGAVDLSETEIDKINKNGWKIRLMSYPNKLTELKNIKIGFEILELDEKPDFLVS